MFATKMFGALYIGLSQWRN